MFQKLYKHLEVMNDSLRQQETHNSRYETAAQKMAEQLERVNEALLAQNELLASRSPSSQAALLQSRRGLTPILQLTNLVLCCVGIVAITYFSVYTYRLSKVTEQAVRQASAQTAAPVRSAGFSGDSVQKIESASRLEKEVAVEQHLAKLDSLISEQSLSLKELKKLNTVAVRTFNHIKRHFDQSDSAATAFTVR